MTTKSRPLLKVWELDEAESYRYVVGGKILVGVMLQAVADSPHTLLLNGLLRSQVMYLYAAVGCADTSGRSLAALLLAQHQRGIRAVKPTNANVNTTGSTIGTFTCRCTKLLQWQSVLVLRMLANIRS